MTPPGSARALATVRERAKTLVELADGCSFLRQRTTVEMTPKAAALLTPGRRAGARRPDRAALAASDAWDAAKHRGVVPRDDRARHGIALGKLAQPVRAAVTGSTASPGIYEVLDVLGRERTLARLRAARARIASVSERSAP